MENILKGASSKTFINEEITFSVVEATLCETICSLGVAPLSARLDKNIIQRLKKCFNVMRDNFCFNFCFKVFKVVARDQRLRFVLH
jgi:hypothetical protein